MKRASDPRRYALHFDGKADPDVLGNVAYLEHFVRRIASNARMTILNLISSNIALDLAKLGKGAFEDEGGYSIQALISTSHIALHVWPKRSHFMLDLVSCRAFDVKEVTEAAVDALKVFKVEFLQEVNDATTITDIDSKPASNRPRLSDSPNRPRLSRS